MSIAGSDLPLSEQEMLRYQQGKKGTAGGGELGREGREFI